VIEVLFLYTKINKL